MLRAAAPRSDLLPRQLMQRVLARRGSGTLVYPNEVVEAAFGVPATTRNSDTVGAIAKALG
jgi:hypothetical protein